MPLIQAEKLKNVCKAILANISVPEKEAEIVADQLVKANLRGVDSHGIVFLSRYVKKVRNGTLKLNAPFRILRENQSTALIDGGMGFGQVLGVKAMKLAIEKARATGIGGVGVRNCVHFGMAAYYAKMASDEDMIGLVTCNGGPAVPPWGGRNKVLGTNPLCFAIPTGSKNPIVLDMSTSLVARGKIMFAKEMGENIPLGWALDEEGKPTTDPDKALEGTLIPMGGYKGYGLAIVVYILSGALTGMACGKDVKSMTFLDEMSTIGQLFISINIESFLPVNEFKKKVDNLIQDLKSTSLMEGFDEILVPGEKELRIEKERLQKGIHLSEQILDNIRNLAREVRASEGDILSVY